MPSSYHVNYSLRPSKSIQRQIVFDGIRILRSGLNPSPSVYVGFGSVWFTDFIMAHTMLKIDRMFSMEEDDTLFRRARFNSPYASVKVLKGSSTNVLPTLCGDETINGQPWVVWLDYDTPFDETSRDDIRTIIERAPDNTNLLITFNAREWKYGRPKDRLKRLRDLFGGVVPDDLCRNRCMGDAMQHTLADLAIDFMRSCAADTGRPGGFVPAFRIAYRDGTDMVTVGGVLPSTRKVAQEVSRLVNDQEWKCRPEKSIVSPLLTIREVMSLQSKLPRRQGLSRDLVRSLGFDLEEDQIEAYERYYREYPAFARIVV